MLDGDQDIDQALEAASNIWAETFKYMADNKVRYANTWGLLSMS